MIENLVRQVVSDILPPDRNAPAQSAPPPGPPPAPPTAPSDPGFLDYLHQGRMNGTLSDDQLALANRLVPQTPVPDQPAAGRAGYGDLSQTRPPAQIGEGPGMTHDQYLDQLPEVPPPQQEVPGTRPLAETLPRPFAHAISERTYLSPGDPKNIAGYGTVSGELVPRLIQSFKGSERTLQEHPLEAVQHGAQRTAEAIPGTVGALAETVFNSRGAGDYAQGLANAFEAEIARRYAGLRLPAGSLSRLIPSKLRGFLPGG